jgi:hypothetical protein
MRDIPAATAAQLPQQTPAPAFFFVFIFSVLPAATAAQRLQQTPAPRQGTLLARLLGAFVSGMTR